MKNIQILLFVLVLAVSFSATRVSAAEQRPSLNQMAESEVERILSAPQYLGTDLHQKPCQVNVQRRDWGVLVYIAPLDIPFYLSVDAKEALARIDSRADRLKVVTQYSGDDADESSDRFMVTSTLTITQNQGLPLSVRVHTYDSGMDLSQDAFCDISLSR